MICPILLHITFKTQTIYTPMSIKLNTISLILSLILLACTKSNESQYTTTTNYYPSNVGYKFTQQQAIPMTQGYDSIFVLQTNVSFNGWPSTLFQYKYVNNLIDTYYVYNSKPTYYEALIKSDTDFFGANNPIQYNCWYQALDTRATINQQYINNSVGSYFNAQGTEKGYITDTTTTILVNGTFTTPNNNRTYTNVYGTEIKLSFVPYTGTIGGTYIIDTSYFAPNIGIICISVNTRPNRRNSNLIKFYYADKTP